VKSPCLMIAPAPMKPMPVTTPCMIFAFTVALAPNTEIAVCARPQLAMADLGPGGANLRREILTEPALEGPEQRFSDEPIMCRRHAITRMPGPKIVQTADGCGDHLHQFALLPTQIGWKQLTQLRRNCEQAIIEKISGRALNQTRAKLARTNAISLRFEFFFARQLFLPRLAATKEAADPDGLLFPSSQVTEIGEDRPD